MFTQVVGEVYRRNGAPHIVDPLLRLLPSLGLWREYGWVQASVEPLALQALKVGSRGGQPGEDDRARSGCGLMCVGRLWHVRPVGKQPTVCIW